MLIVNHQHKLHPSERTAELYSRPEFVASLESLPVKVISTVELFNWWRGEDWTAIRTAALGDAATSWRPAAPTSPEQSPSAPRRRWWTGGRRG